MKWFRLHSLCMGLLISALSCGLESRLSVSSKKPFQIIQIEPSSQLITPDAKISITFSEAIISEETDNIRVYLKNDDRKKYIESSIEINQQGTMATIYPKHNLEHGKKYCLSLEKIRSAQGMRLLLLDDEEANYCLLVKTLPTLFYSDVLHKDQEGVSPFKRKFRFVFSDAITISYTMIVLKCVETGEEVPFDFIEQSEDRKSISIYLPKTFEFKPNMTYEWIFNSDLRDNYNRNFKIPEIKFTIADEQLEQKFDISGMPELSMDKDKAKISIKSCHPFLAHVWYGLAQEPMDCLGKCPIESRAVKRKGPKDSVYYLLSIDMNGLLFNKEYRYIVALENEFAQRHVFQNQFVHNPSQKDEGE